MSGMPIQIAGIPLHPLIVHAPIVLVPLFVLLVLLYVVIPPIRRHIGWAVFTLTILAPATVFLARLSGEEFRTAKIFADAATEINKHEGYSTVLFWLLVAIAPITWLFAALERGRRTARARRDDSYTPVASDGDDDSATTRKLSASDDDPASKGRVIVMVVLGLVMLGLAGVSAYYAYKTGDSGARMAWEDTPLDK